jgi:glycosyltransferase involved in cell wall biosynthesis
VSAGQWLLAAALLVPAVWRVAVIVTILRDRTRLPRVATASLPHAWSLVSVIVPARNEDRGLEACLTSLSAQTHAPLEILVVDDASTDRTPEIIAASVARDPRIRPFRVDGPPPGWTGKNFALASAVPAARGTWLLFTDADTIHVPEAIARAVGFAEAHGVALLSLTSRQLAASFWERVIQPVVFGLLDQWYPLGRVNDPTSSLAAASGIFILVSREAYAAVDGHRAVAGEVLEDVALARNVKRSGRRVLFADGADLVSARMYADLPAIRRGWTKNLHALRDRHIGRALSSAAGLFLTAVWPTLALVGAAVSGHRVAVLLAGSATGVVLAAEALFRVRRGHDPAWSPTLPLGALLVLGFLLESAIRGRLGLGVHWKGRHYERS